MLYGPTTPCLSCGRALEAARYDDDLDLLTCRRCGCTYARGMVLTVPRRAWVRLFACACPGAVTLEGDTLVLDRGSCRCGAFRPTACGCGRCGR